MVPLLVFTCLLSGSFAQPTTQPDVGHRQVTFNERSPHSGIEEQHRRHKINIEDVQKYDLANESYELVVPQDYDGERPFGILVWVSPMPSGRAPDAWLPVLEKHKLIWVGANNAGNQRGIAVRFGLALDAVHNLQMQYNIDESRIYAAGFSGGGKAAAMLGVIYPEVFSGSIPMGGAAFYRSIPVPGRKNAVYPPLFDRPPRKMYDLARQRTRFALVIGTEDFNYIPVKAKYEDGFLKDEFEHVTYIEIPGLAHELCDESWFERAILALDEPLVQSAKDLLAQGEELEKQGKFSDAHRIYLQASVHGGDTIGEKADDRIASLFERARVEFVQARRAAEAGEYAQAASILLRLREQYGAVLPPEAGELLRDLQTNPASAAQIKAQQDRDAALARDAAAEAALERARLLIERDVKRAHQALRKVAAEFPNTPAAADATAEADKMLTDPKLKAQIELDPNEVEAGRLLNLAQNYLRNGMREQARERLLKISTDYPATKAAAEARRLLEQMQK